jgi:hypothetical protein
MKLEHKKQKVVPFPNFLMRLGRYSLLALFLVIISLAIGIAGYHFIGQLSWIDSFYMSSMILTGMGPIGDLPMRTNAGKLFSSFFALYSGVAFLTMTAVFLTPIIHRLLHILHVEQDENES